MAKVVNTAEMTREEWLKARQSGVGGSDAGTILGVNKWKSKTQLFFEKTNPTLKQEIDNEFIYWGNVLEDVVAKEFERRTGKKVRKYNKMLRHPEHDFMLANLDRVVVGEKALLECKTTSQYNIDQWKDDEVPANYLCQVQHYLAVTGFDKAYIAVLCGGNQFIWKEIPRDNELIEIIINAEKEFWYDHVLMDDIPEMDGSDSTKEFLNHMYKDIDESEIQLGSDVEILLKGLEQVKAEEKQLKELKTKYENQLKDKLGHHIVGSTVNYLITWKPQVKKTLDSKKLKEVYGDELDPYYKESETRVLKIKEIKGEI